MAATTLSVETLDVGRASAGPSGAGVRDRRVVGADRPSARSSRAGAGSSRRRLRAAIVRAARCVDQRRRSSAPCVRPQRSRWPARVPHRASSRERVAGVRAPSLRARATGLAGSRRAASVRHGRSARPDGAGSRRRARAVATEPAERRDGPVSALSRSTAHVDRSARATHASRRAIARATRSTTGGARRRHGARAGREARARRTSVDRRPNRLRSQPRAATGRAEPRRWCLMSLRSFAR